MDEKFSVSTATFSGPLDLLLDLVEKRKLHINDVSLAQITEGFLKYLKEAEELPKDEVAEFLVIASTLMLIKSVSLLPGLSLTEEETESVAELERRLQMLSHIREGAELIRKYFGAASLFLPHAAPPRQTVFMPPRDMSLSSLSVALVAVIASFPKEEKLQVVYHLYSYTFRHQVVLKVDLSREAACVSTMEGVWKVANWFEREVFDLFGVVFDGHSDLRRILLPEDWEGYPLRKDYVEQEEYDGISTERAPLVEKLLR